MIHTGETLRVMVQQVLMKHGCEKACIALEDAAEEIGKTTANLEGKIKIYKWLGMIVLILIPTISAVLSIMVTDRSPRLAVFVQYLSYGLTFVTLYNSIFVPRERFTRLCRMGIPLHQLGIAFIARLEMLHVPIEESKLHDLASEFNQRLLPFKRELIGMFLPQTDVDGMKGVKVEQPPRNGSRPSRPDLQIVKKGSHAEAGMAKRRRTG